MEDLQSNGDRRRNLHDLINFEENRRNVAVLFYDDEKDEEISFSYETLQKLSSDLSEILIHLIDGQSCNIGIFCDPCEKLPFLLLGILQASCCFVYLPTRETPDYLHNWSSACEIRLILSFKQNWKVKFPNHNLTMILTNGIEIISEKSPKIIFPNETPIAYVMRTSGTTGQFKTVKVPHDAIVPNILHLKQIFEVNSSDAVFLSSPLTFDPSIVEIFVALSSGAKLLIVPNKMKTNPKLLSEILFEKYKITILQSTPSLFLSFGDDVISTKILSESSTLRVLALGGEKFPTANVDRNWNLNNKTKIFDIYGITEVSCWATCQEIARKMLKKNEVPLGRSLMDTEIKIRWLNFGNVGELYVGGTKRRCILGSESLESAPDFRATGDLVKRNVNGRCFFVGRSDSQIKRFGKKINLEEINSIVLRSSPMVDKSVCFFDDQRLFIALTSKINIRKNEESEFLLNVKTFVDAYLPSHSRPDRYFILGQFPLTEHGKVDKKTLQRNVFETFNSSKTTKKFSKENIFNGLLELIEEVLGEENISKQIVGDSFLWNFGCDSVKSLHLVSKLEQWCQRKLPNALEIIIYKTVDELCKYIKNVVFESADEFDDAKIAEKSVNDSKYRKRSSKGIAKRVKRAKTNNLLVYQKSDSLQNFHDDSTILNGKFLKISWTWDSGKCIDGSPLIVDDEFGCNVYIGSHSHNFASIDAVSGEIRWIRRLGDRIEGSAAVTRCGTYLIIGSFDHCVYFLERKHGNIFWRFKTGDVVKSTPCVMQTGGFVFVGGHDGCLYALNYLNQTVIWKLNVSSSIASTPCLDIDEERIFFATLNGWIRCVSTSFGDLIWAKNFIKPIFAQLILFEDNLLFGSVDGCVYFVDISNGNIKRKFSTSEPIFNALGLFSNSFEEKFSYFLIVGNIKGDVYCLDWDATTIWKVSLNDAVTTSPYLFSVKIDDERKIFCCLCTKNGNVFVLEAVDGKTIAKFVLPGEVFSSPVVWLNNVYVGCRNDKLFCLNFCKNEFRPE